MCGRAGLARVNQSKTFLVIVTYSITEWNLVTIYHIKVAKKMLINLVPALLKFFIITYEIMEI